MKRPAVILASCLLLACSSSDPLIDQVNATKLTVGAINLHTIYAFPPFTDAPVPIYLTVINTGTSADTLLAVGSPSADRVMIHGGSMASLGALVVGPGDTLRLEPGGLHLMLEPPTPAFVRGDAVEVTLRFSRAGVVSLMAPVIAHVDADDVR